MMERDRYRDARIAWFSFLQFEHVEMFSKNKFTNTHFMGTNLHLSYDDDCN